jgi:hypothetical protein
MHIIHKNQSILAVSRYRLVDTFPYNMEENTRDSWEDQPAADLSAMESTANRKAN